MKARWLLIHKQSMNNCISCLNSRKWSRTSLNKIMSLKGTRMSVHSLLSCRVLTCHREIWKEWMWFKTSQCRSRLIDWIKGEKRKRGSKCLWKRELYRRENLMLMNLLLLHSLESQTPFRIGSHQDRKLCRRLEWKQRKRRLICSITTCQYHQAKTVNY
jgi:hypothetical protein